MSVAEEPEKKVPKSEVTRSKIVAAAMELFREKGYEQATMRLIAQRAGVSLGNAYYYFPSKEALIQGYYQELFEGFADRAQPVLESEIDFVGRLTGVLHAWVDNARPFHGFASDFFRYAADPKSSLSPFSPESSQTRTACIGLHRRVVEGSRKLKMSDDLREQLPELLWLYQMGIVLFWVYDDSKDQRKTKQLIERTVPIIGRLLNLSRLPVLRSTSADLSHLIDELKKRR